MEGMKRFYYPIIKGETIGNIASAVITTDITDRQNEVVEPDGASIVNYMNNPVVQYGHAYQGIESIPVGRTISLEFFHEGDVKGIKARWEWQQDDVTPLISAVHKSWDRGFINTASIGFMPNKFQDNHITKWEMLEWSICPVPANPTALRLNGFTDAEVKALTPEEIVLSRYSVDVTPETLISDLEAMVVTKEGRVLSTKNRTLISDCVSSLNALLEATDTSPAGAGQPEPDDWLTALYKSMFCDNQNDRT